MKILLITPPLIQLNTAYPATTTLTGFLRHVGIDAQQCDLSIELVNAIFSKANIACVFDGLADKKLSKWARIMQQNADFYINAIEPVMRFLGGKDQRLCQRFSQTEFWPISKAIPDEEELEWAFGTQGNYDRAVYLCSLFLKDLAKLIKDYVDPHFEMIRYAESLCLRLPTFDPLADALAQPPSFVEEIMLTLFEKQIAKHQPDFVGFTVPFPGNLLSALRCSKWLRSHYPNTKIVMGGGYVNTELRSISDKRLFEYIDYLVFDDGEIPLLNLLTGKALVRTLFVENNEINRESFESKVNHPFKQTIAPTYDGLMQNNYFNFFDMLNPMHALWSNGKWNKMMLAHGCYWSKCSFCDGSLDYIGRFEQAPIERIVDIMEQIMAETGESGFHFVDEAAPPALLRKLSEEILRRKLTVSYWTNVRFEKSYDVELCYLMAKSGCIAISGGLEVASERILKLINKGITIETAGQSMKNFSDAGIMTHAYLMYGFPTETARETIESLDEVRNLFEKGWMHSAFWHRYAMTIHSPSGISPASVGAERLDLAPDPFANNEVPFSTKNPIDLEFYGKGLNLATYNYMRGTGFDIPVKDWFK